jgi:DNA-binding MarR family transcriptional regulator
MMMNERMNYKEVNMNRINSLYEWEWEWDVFTALFWRKPQLTREEVNYAVTLYVSNRWNKAASKYLNNKHRPMVNAAIDRMIAKGLLKEQGGKVSATPEGEQARERMSTIHGLWMVGEHIDGMMWVAVDYALFGYDRETIKSFTVDLTDSQRAWLRASFKELLATGVIRIEGESYAIVDKTLHLELYNYLVLKGVAE